MKAIAKPQKKPVGVKAGLAFALTFFVVSIVLFFLPQYFGSWTSWIAIGFTIAGFMFLGLELNRLTEEWEIVSKQTNNGREIFDKIGIGIGLLILWGIIVFNFRYILLNVIMFHPLFFGVSFVLVGIVNLIFDFVLSKKELEDQRIA